MIDFSLIAQIGIRRLLLPLAIVASMGVASQMAVTGESSTRIKREPFGTMPDQRQVDLYSLTNQSGMEVRIMTYGGAIVSLRVPDRAGRIGDVVLGYDRLDGYLENNPYFGGIIGRYGNRIAKGRFSLNGREYVLARNNGANHLHGGVKGFDRAVWKAKETSSPEGARLELNYVSKDGEEGYPGNLSVTVAYTLSDRNELKIQYAATTDKDTVVNLTSHSYFNLAGGGTILNHELLINGSRFTPVDQGLIPTGELRRVKGTPMDFTRPTPIGSRIDEQDEQLVFGKGYDHNWVLDHTGSVTALAARLYDPGTGRVLEIHTTEPGLQFYSGNFLDGSITGKGSQVYHKRHGLCLEPQHFPDSPNKPGFPSTVLRRGRKYASTTVYKFSVTE